MSSYVHWLVTIMVVGVSAISRSEKGVRRPVAKEPYTLKKNWWGGNNSSRIHWSLSLTS